MVFRCLLNTHACTALYLIFWRAVLLKHSHSNSHTLFDWPVRHRKALSRILSSKPAISVNCFLGYRMFLPCGTPRILKAVGQLLGRFFSPSTSINVAFSFWYWYSGLSNLVVFQLSTKIKAKTLLVFVSLKHQLNVFQEQERE